LSFGQPAIPDLEMQFGVDRRTEPDRIGGRPQQNCSGVGGDLPVCRGKLDFGRGPGYSHLASASCARELVGLVTPFSLLRRPFLWISGPGFLTLLMVLSS